MSVDKTDWQLQGGTIEIPDGFFLHGANFDVEDPYIELESDALPRQRLKLPVPKAMAYYLSRHHCGSFEFRKNVEDMAVEALRRRIKDALGL